MPLPPEFHPADPALRRTARWLPVVVVVAGALALLLLQHWLDRPDAAGRFEALLLGYAGLSALLATAGLVLALSLWSEATRVRSEDRYPSSRMRTVREVPIVRGAAARRAAGWLRAAAAVAALFSLAMLAWAVRSLQPLA
jgi:hypothetical protein